MNIKEEVMKIAENARKASYKAALLTTKEKDNVLLAIADAILKEKAILQAENEKDLKAAEEKGLSAAMIDRLRLTDKVINNMVEGLRQVANLSDPVGEILGMKKRPNGLMVGQMRIPLGVIGIIYESRPNVTIDATALCLKSGNATILRGGSEAIHSNRAISGLIHKVLKEKGLPKGLVQVIPMTDREAITEMLKLDELIDLVIPRGGESLIRFVGENSRIPVIKHYNGICHVYVDEFADLKMATDIAFNAKVQRPGVCNAMETLLVHKSVAKDYLPMIYAEYKKAKVEVRGCKETKAILSDIKEATEEDWNTEYLDLIISIKVVDSMADSIAHIEKYGSLHTETIVTKDYQNSQDFLKSVNSSCVMINASTRFSDGFELGLGAEIGISTTKLHAYGPMGLEGLTAKKFIIYGEGQIRE